MSFLNPWAFLMIGIVLWIFKDIVVLKSQNRVILVTLILALIALARPIITNEITKEKFVAHEYILALDASFSMNMDDIKPSRYKLAKQNIISLLNKNTNDMFSIFAFTTNPLLISPPTTDHNIAISALDALTQEYILTKGTSLTTLLEQISKLEQKHKSLIIFSDGGEENDVDALLSIAHKNSITINIVATGSKNGTILKKDNKAIKDVDAHLIISRVNPILKTLASGTKGFYIELDADHKDISLEIQTYLDKQNLDAQKLDADIVSYKELYFIPLFIAFVLLLTSLTKFQKYIPFLALLLFVSPNFDTSASMLDFYHKKVAQEAYKDKNYTLAIKEFKKLTPSKYSYISIANSYYKNKEYKNAMRYYSMIKSKNKKIKSIVFYNMANSASRLKKYKRAKTLYKQSLALNYTKEAYENLLKIIKLEPKTDVSAMLPHVDSKKVKNISQKQEQKQDDKKQQSSSSKSQQKASKATQGGGSNSKKKKDAKTSQKQGDKNRYKMGYNAYELINKGYLDEKRPW